MLNQLNANATFELLHSESLLANFPGGLIIKDVNSKFLAGNLLCVKLTGFNSIDQLVGLSDYDVKCEAANFAEDFIKEDKIALYQEGELSSFCVMKYADNKIHTILFNKKSVYLKESDQQVLICQGVPLNSSLVNNLAYNLVEHDQRNHAHNRPIMGSFLLNNPKVSDITLTKQQSFCLFYILRGKSTKEIAQIMNLSPRTAETYVALLKEKFGCRSKAELIETAMAKGFYYVLPNDILNIKF